jgi:hypothetical protein
MSLWRWSSSLRGRVLVEGLVAEHGEQDVAAASGQADEGGGSERAARVAQFVVAGAGVVLAVDAGVGGPVLAIVYAIR